MRCDEAKPLLLDHRRDKLGAAERARVDEHLATCDACRAELAAEVELDRALGRLPNLEAPASLARALEARWAPKPEAKPVPRSRAHFVFAALALAAAVALFVAKGGVRGEEPSALATEAVNDHLRVLYSEHPIEIASGGLHQVKPWFAGRLDFAPVLAFEGDDEFPLQGGSVGYFVDRKAAVLVFKRRLHTISLLVVRADGLPWPGGSVDLGRARAHVEDSRGFHTVLWREGDLGYALVSDLNREELLVLARKLEGP